MQLIKFYDYINIQILLLKISIKSSSYVQHTVGKYARYFGIMGGHGDFPFNLLVKMSVELGYVFLSLRL
jgi:hypothetical protein